MERIQGTHTPLFRWVNSQLVSRCNGKTGTLPTSASLARTGNVGEQAHPLCLGLDPEPLITAPCQSDKQLNVSRKLIITKLFIDTEEQKGNKRKLGLAR